MWLDGNCGKSGKKKTLIFCTILPVGVVFCMPGQYRVFYRDFYPFIQQVLAELTKILGRVVHIDDCTAQLIPNMFYWVAVWRSCRRSILVTLPCWWKSSSTEHGEFIVLVAVVVPEMLPGKWNYGVSQNAPVACVELICRGAQEALSYRCEKLTKTCTETQPAWTQ